MEGKANPPRHMEPLGHQDVLDQTQKARNLEIVVNVNFKRGLQCQEAGKRACRQLRQLKRTVGSRCSNVPLPLLKAFSRRHLECCVQVRRPHLVGDMKMLEWIQRGLHAGLDVLAHAV